MKFLIMALFVLFCCDASAAWISKQGETLPNEEHRKSVGSFGAQLILTDDEEGLFQKWATPSETVELKTVENTSINKPICAFIIFSGCQPDTSGNCHVSMRFRVIQPDGKVYTDSPIMEVWHDKPAPPGRTLELSVQYLKVVVEPHEQLGRYIVMTQVRDDKTGTVLFLQKEFTATDSSAKTKHNQADSPDRKAVR